MDANTQDILKKHAVIKLLNSETTRDKNFTCFTAYLAKKHQNNLIIVDMKLM